MLTATSATSANAEANLLFTNNTLTVQNNISTVNNLYVGGTANISSITTNQLAVSTITTVSSITVGSDLTVTGTIRGNVYGIGDYGSQTYINLGTWTAAQTGQTLYMHLVSHAGYNASIAQNQVTELIFKTSNTRSVQSGSTGDFYADGIAYVNSRLGTGGTFPATMTAPSQFIVVQNSVTSYTFYGLFVAYMGGSSYYIQTPPANTWVNSGAIAGNTTTPSGNSITIVPSYV